MTPFCSRGKIKLQSDKAFMENGLYQKGIWGAKWLCGVDGIVRLMVTRAVFYILSQRPASPTPVFRNTEYLWAGEKCGGSGCLKCEDWEATGLPGSSRAVPPSLLFPK